MNPPRNRKSAAGNPLPTERAPVLDPTCERPGVKLPRATDPAICCRGQGESALATMRDMMSKLRLTVNENKTRVCKLPEEKFDFLGYTFGRCYSPQTGRAYLGTTPSKKRVQRVCAAISLATRRGLTAAGRTDDSSRA